MSGQQWVLQFDQPSCGATRDVKELEYISALHQTGTDIRSDGTITPRDISLLLLSRHGINIDEKDIENELL